MVTYAMLCGLIEYHGWNPFRSLMDCNWHEDYYFDKGILLYKDGGQVPVEEIEEHFIPESQSIECGYWG